MTDTARWARRLLDAERHREPLPPLTDEAPDLTVEDAYPVQDELVAQRTTAGEHLVGAKLGLTSRAKQEAMGVREPIYAWLTDAMAVTGGVMRAGELIHPRVEPEIVFVLGRDLAGPGLTPAAALDAVAGVTCGIEVIDSRYRDFRFTLPDVVADNASSARFQLGARVRDPGAVDLATVGCALAVGVRDVHHATGAAVLGHPAVALALLANDLGRRQKALRAGWVVLTGGLTEAVAVTAGDHVEARFGGGLGTVTLRVVP